MGFPSLATFSTICGKVKNNNYMILHCNSIYPVPAHLVNLPLMDTYNSMFKCPVGFSDHSLGYTENRNLASLAAIYMGAKFVERHITILDKEKTKDGKVSIKPEDIKILKNFSNLKKKDQLRYLRENFELNLNSLQGKQFRKLSEEEILNRDYYRGRFVSKLKNREIYNWEEVSIK